jgi:hypothetical protein
MQLSYCCLGPINCCLGPINCCLNGAHQLLFGAHQLLFGAHQLLRSQHLLRSLSLPLPFGAHRLALQSCWRVVGSPLLLAHSGLVSARWRGRGLGRAPLARSWRRCVNVFTHKSCTNMLFCWAHQLLRSLSLPLPFGAHRLALQSCWRVVGSPLLLAHSDLVSARLARPWPRPRPTRPQLAMLCECVYTYILAPTACFVGPITC